ncbi:MAG: protein DpdJ [Enhygromyxa sp.]
MDELAAASLKLLDELQLRELRLLSWGMIDSFFSRNELEDIAYDLIDRENIDEDPSGLIGWLRERVLLVEVDEDHGRFRTRSAEAVRLFARMRQIFPWRVWNRSPELVSDFRFVTLPRMYPDRDIDVDHAMNQLADSLGITEVQLQVGRALLGGEGTRWKLARFQVDATERILGRVTDRRSTGTIVCAGTGSGKTLAFYIPAFMHILENARPQSTTQCLAIYPRKELLRDQLQTAIDNARRVEAVAMQHLGRPLSIGVLYGSVPWDGNGLDLPWLTSSWPHISCRGKSARRCPYIDCPECNAPIGWPDDERRAGREHLACSQCAVEVTGQQLRLTRNSASANPPDILFGTTEMLNRAMGNRGQWKLFGIGPDVTPPSLVLLDEVHTYGGVAGAQVGLTLRRWRHLANARAHFVGLSATLADAPRFMAQLVGLYPNHVVAVEPRKLVQQGCEHIIALRGKPGTATLSTTIQASMLLRRILDSDPPKAGNVAGQRVFVFTDNLDVTNRLYYQLGEAEGWSRPHRPRRPARTPPLASLRASGTPEHAARKRDGQAWDVAEEIGHQLKPDGRAVVSRTSSQDAGVAGDADIVVATASLEVGFDDPKVGGVVQHQAPRDPAAYVQRKGRAGRNREMRPWTVVVLSDWGRDRQAYRSYEHLFSPSVPPRYLPIRNRHVLRMQGALSFMDWLAGQVQYADLWHDLRKPGTGATRQRQRAITTKLQQLLTDPDVLEQFSRHLQLSLGLESASEALALIWEPPRALLFSVWPTLLRRLEREWKRADGSKETPAGHPLPEFIPRALFEDLNLPEVAIRVEQYRGKRRGDDGAEENDHWMPIRQALSEFAPGRVSRRFGIEHALDAHWVAPPEGYIGALDIATFCPHEDAQALGAFQYIEDGVIREVQVFRPHRLHTRQPGRDVHERSDARPIWHTQIQRDSEGTAVMLPRGTSWQSFFSELRFFTHVAGNPAEVRRFTTGAHASIRDARPPMKAHEGLIHYTWTREGEPTPAALGFGASHDGIALTLAMPNTLRDKIADNSELFRSVVGALFFDGLRNSTELDGTANSFQRAAIAETFIAAALVGAEREGTSLADITRRIAKGSERRLIGQVVATLRPADRLAGTMNELDQDPADNDLIALFDNPLVLEALGKASKVFGRALGVEDEPWLKMSLRATAAGAILGAFQRLCPQLDAGDLLVELSPGPGPEGDEPRDEVWFTEATVGGSGFIESIQRALTEDPRRFIHIVEAELEPSDFEEVDHYLRLVLERLVPGTDEHDADLARIFHDVRAAGTFAKKHAGFDVLLGALRIRGIATSHAVVSAISLRLLRPGSSTETDRLLLELVERHDALAAKHGVSFDDRVYAAMLAFDDRVTADLKRVSPELRLESPADRHSVLTSLLWPRGANIRRQSLAFWNPFGHPAVVDRLMLEAIVPHQPTIVSVEDKHWRVLLDAALLQEGRAGLVAPLTKVGLLRDATLALASEPIVSDSLMLYARVRAYKRTVGQAMLIFDMPEALQ